ncbi:MAG: hypothetical protein ACHQU0_03905, partial [Candidatus Paceibacteria bacterium]
PSSLTSLDALASAPSGCNQSLFRRSLAHDLDYLRDPGYERLNVQVVEVKKMLSSLMQKVKVFN